MRYLFIVLILLFTYSTGICQHTDSIPKSKKWMVSLHLSPDFFIGNNKIKLRGDYIGYNLKKSRLSFTTGLGIDYRVDKSLTVYSGISYSLKRFKGKLFCHTCDLAYSKNKVNLHFIEAPITLKYYFLHITSISFFINGGINNIFSLSNIENPVKDYENEYLIGFKTGTGIDYDINNNMGLKFEVLYNQPFMKITLQPNQLNYHQFSVMTGVFCRF